MCYLVLLNTNAVSLLKPKISLILLLSALGHDLGHVGLCNKTLIQIRHPLALRYNLKSPLENHHISILTDLLFTSKNTEIFADISLEEKNHIHQLIYDIIISTDMQIESS